MNFKLYISFLLISSLLFSTRVFSQKYGMGALLDEKYYQDVPEAAQLMRSDYSNLPSFYSIKQYAPTPGNQGQTSTCTGWAVAYSARTIISAMQSNWTKKQINENTFSPSYIYNLIRPKEGCNVGTSLSDGLKILKEYGAIKTSQFGFDCDKIVSNEHHQIADKFKIKEYRQLVNRKTKDKISLIKKSLSENNPVVVAINCPDSFQDVEEVWQPDSSDYQNNFAGHAITIVSYNDKKENGAFEIMNSWGTDWGDEGFAWIKYTDFEQFCVWGGELIAMKEREQDNLFNGAISLNKLNGEKITLQLKDQYFSTKNSHKTGTRFQLKLTNNEPAYVYVISSDLSFKTTINFPFDNFTSPFLPYKENNVIIPGEQYAFQLDENDGITFFCVLYSSAPFDIKRFAKIVEYKRGTFLNRINSVIKEIGYNKTGQDFLIQTDNEITFSTNAQEKTILPIVVSIPHEKI
ncbi:MAG: DUF4384 domain-containing protein [Ignavibacteriae bacterium]|nr:DUF4384 domain-containing protein [Ignavibacteriota bacterium]NOG99541.1 DUF4384 domain-containing protein [Ignavibacteriota bacterium]